MRRLNVGRRALAALAVTRGLVLPLRIATLLFCAAVDAAAGGRGPVVHPVAGAGRPAAGGRSHAGLALAGVHDDAGAADGGLVAARLVLLEAGAERHRPWLAASARQQAHHPAARGLAAA